MDLNVYLIRRHVLGELFPFEVVLLQSIETCWHYIQLVYGITGLTVNSVEGSAFRIHYLLDNPELMGKMGEDAKEYVRRNFLITRHLGDYLALMNFWVREKLRGEKICEA
ncbi:MAG: hypothetical protein QME78_01120 [Thermodesulfobacteriota bacterium]|nr:hypothetical protein [Thermodesulfobacteriota bacterium]